MCSNGSRRERRSVKCKGRIRPFSMKEFDFLNSMESAAVGAEMKRRMAIVSARPHCSRGGKRDAHLAD